MSETCPTVRIKPSHPSQGDHVVINASDFDAKKHELLDAPPAPAQPPGAPLPEQAGTMSADKPPAVATLTGSTVPDTAYLPTAERAAGQRAVEIPADWQELPWNALRKVASQVCDDPITNKDAAFAAIEAELARRGAAQQ